MFLLSNRGLDVSEALQLPGVVDVITAKDIPGQKVRTMSGYDEELFAETEVEYECVHISFLMGCVCVQYMYKEQL